MVGAPDVANDPYKWDATGRGSHRELKPGRGMYHDVRRRLPFYWSDIRDGFNYKTIQATIRIYFVNLLPALAFTLDMNHNAGGFFGINEALLSSALAAMVFSIFSIQPLTVVGITGLISLFSYTIYHQIQQHPEVQYQHIMVWVGIWSAIFHWLTALLNWCDYMRCITDFSSQTFAMYVGTIYILKGIEEIAIGFYDNSITNGFASALVAVLFSLTIYWLEKFREVTFGRGWLRQLLSDYAYPIATIWWTGFCHFPGNLSYVDFKFLPTTRAFYPSTDRPWVVDFWNIDVKWVFVAMPYGLLMTVLFYYDHNVSSLTAQARNFPLKKPAGFHWDFFLLGITCAVAGVLNIPLPNGLVPQAPVHTDACTWYSEHATEIRTTNSDSDSDTTPPVIIEKQTTADRVAEQRLSHFVMGLAIIGTMTRPLLVVLGLMPRAIFSGVFFVVGWGSIESNGIITKLLYLLREPRFRQPHEPLEKVPKKQIWKFVGWQLFGWVCTVAVSQTLGAIGFPVLICALIPLRWVLFPRWFTEEELSIMDHLTATGDVVLVSLGGKPEMPEVERARKGREMEDEERRGERAGEDATAEKRREDKEREGQAPWSSFHRRTSSAASRPDGRSPERPEGIMRLRREKTNQSRMSGRSAVDDAVFEDEEEDSDRTRTNYR